MKTTKILFYIFKLLALAFLAFLLAKESSSKTMYFILIGFVALLLIIEGFSIFRTKDNN